MAATLSLSLNPNTFPKPHSLSSLKIRCNATNNPHPIAPWMKTPYIETPEKTKTPPKKPDNSLTEKVSGARGKRAMKEILRGIEKMDKTQKNPDRNLDKDESFSSFGEDRGLVIERVGRKKEETRKMDKTQNNTDGNLAKDENFSVFRKKIPWEGEERRLVIERVRKEKDEILGGIGKMGKTQNNPVGNLAKDDSFSRFREKMPWEGEEKGVVFGKVRREKEVSAAKLSVDGEVLKRLKSEAAKMRVWVKVNKAGVTQDVVDQVRITWRNDELAMMKFDVPLRWNMGRAREIVENKTGGLVIWTRNDTLVVYRGCNYKSELETSPKMRSNLSNGNIAREDVIGINNSDLDAKAINDSLYVREADRLLDGLGPRFIDWWMEKPLPVDGDLLPEVVINFKPPFRLCPPHHCRAKLSDYELTYLRKLARPLPTHFVIGRNRKLQGLAAAILKLWEKCHIVKIAVKWGAMNTNNEEMAKELKDLTGGVLLLRNKFIIIIYRGKDFLPCGVADQVVEREMEIREFQLEEESARAKTIDLLNTTGEYCINSSSTGTLSEYRELQSDCAYLYNGYMEVNVQFEAEKERLKKQLRNQERKLLILQMKINRSSKELAKLNSSCWPAENDVDEEIISEEERECFRKIGLKLDSSLLLGRRGVFKGVIEGVYQHWKHREVAKVITMQRLLSRVVYTAKQLESETGGILVSVDKLKEGHAIILYRGKNHKRPQNFVSPNLLTKREALSRSLEMQRNGSLKFFAYQRLKAISELKCKLEDLEKRRRTGRREPVM